MQELSQEEIQQRLIKLRNFEQLYPRARERIRLLQQSSYQKDTIIKKQEQLARLQSEAIEHFKLRIEELEIMVFGKKKDKDNRNGKGKTKKGSRGLWSKLFGNKKKERSPDSYRRQLPKEAEITNRKDYPIETCPCCKSQLTDFNIAIRYLEDIKILEKALKEITKQWIQTGFCSRCQKRFSSIPVSKQTVSLGENTKSFVVYSITILRQSFEQTKNLLQDVFDLKISDGEISSILKQHSKKLLPQYHRLKQNIRGSPAVHYDETTYKLQKEEPESGNFAWVATGSDTADTVFELGKNRGKGNAKSCVAARQQNKSLFPTTTELTRICTNTINSAGPIC